ncbi:homogentisate phytyltransferase 1 [Citrus sinensis]|uniref:Homogentisate phytyltransferase 1 n=1 Tax=Citrus sinensis TaxID=2711 RepID=A0ACB8NMT2_CITSI|nr:homogentisate phytyltransferase 1 [Citrus sinensis]
MMLQMHSSSSFSPKYYYPLQHAGCDKTLQLPLTKVHGGLNRSESKNYAIKCTQSDSFYSTNKIKNNENTSSRNCKPFNKYRVAVTLQQQGCASNNEDDINSTSFWDVLLKKLHALYVFTRPFAMIGTIVGITSIAILPLQSFADLTPKYFMEFLKALLSAVLMNNYVGTVNQVADVEIDKVNKPDLPLASGDLSMGTGLAITLTLSLTSLAIALSLQSPPLIFGLIVWFLLGTAYSVDLPFLRWKTKPFLAGMCMVTVFGLVYQFSFFIHFQKYVLGRPVVITRPLIFAAAIISTISAVMSLLKDIPDEDGDKQFGFQSISSKLGKENHNVFCLLKRYFGFVFMRCFFAYGVSVIVGASSSFQLVKLVSIIGHSTLAFLLWLRAQTVDLSNNASTYSFYMFIWKASVIDLFNLMFEFEIKFTQVRLFSSRLTSNYFVEFAVVLC